MVLGTIYAFQKNATKAPGLRLTVADSWLIDTQQQAQPTTHPQSTTVEEDL